MRRTRSTRQRPLDGTRPAPSSRPPFQAGQSARTGNPGKTLRRPPAIAATAASSEPYRSHKSQGPHRHLDDGRVSAGSMLTSPSSALIDSCRTGYRSCTRRRPSLQQQGPPVHPSGEHGAAVRDVAPPTAAGAAFPAAAGLCRPFAGLRFIPARAGRTRARSNGPSRPGVHPRFRSPGGVYKPPFLSDLRCRRSDCQPKLPAESVAGLCP